MIKSSIPWSAKQVAKMAENNSLNFDNAIQRGEVWDVKKKSLFIDSLLRGYPVPPMYTIKTDEKVQTPKGMVSVFDCIDGKQRCTTIAHFKANEFALTGIEDTIVLEDGSEMEINGLTYDELPEELREVFDDYSISVYKFEDITDDEICEMMSRLNNGKALTNVENARIKAKDLAGLIELSKHQLFSDYLTETAIKGYQNEDITIKTYIQFTNTEDPCLDAKRAREVYNNVEFTDKIKKSKQMRRRVAKRSKALFLVFLAGSCVLLGSVVLTVAVHGEEYSRKVMDQKASSNSTLSGLRGSITDRKGTVLAYSNRVYTLILDPVVFNTKRTA